MNSAFKIINTQQGKMVEMNHSTANVLNPSFFQKFGETLRSINPHDNLIITGNGRFFSSGLDLFYINAFNEAEIIQFMEQFQSMLKAIIHRSGKTLAVVNGHTVAGGFILASACDNAYCTPGKYKLGMNEEKLGIKLPPLPQAIIQSTFGDDMEKILCKDQFYNPEEMSQFSHFSETALSFDDVEKDEKRIKNIEAFMDTSGDAQMDIFLQSWFSDKSINARNAALKVLRST